MPSRRTSIAIVAGTVIALIGVGLAGYVLMRDPATPATGDLIAYGCKEPSNRWYAICVVGMDGTNAKPTDTEDGHERSQLVSRLRPNRVHAPRRRR